MCIICVEFQKNTMTIVEARTALKELIVFSTSDEEKAHLQGLAKASDEEFRAIAKKATD